MTQSSTPDEYDRSVLQTFLVDGRLRTIPARQRKKEAILRFLVQQFAYDRTYTESEVNTVLETYHPDFASLRRYLINARLMQREDGVYWRTPASGAFPSDPMDD